MKDSTLLKISFMFAILGLLSMLYLSDKLEPKIIQISSINEGLLENNIKIQGAVISAKTLKSIQLLEVQDISGKIQIVMFDITPKIKKGSYIEVQGKVSKYKNNMQINAD